VRDRRRAEASQYAERVNRAVALLRRGPVGTVLPVLVRRYQVSPRQARRYVDAAQQHPQGVPVPEPTVVFTIKLPVGLVRRVRAQATRTGTRLSTLVTRALEDWLEGVRLGPPGGR
jgi:predicted DNA-binding transcriptional regulator YafY